VARHLKHASVVVRGEVLTEQADGRQRDRALSEQLEDDWVTSNRARGLDSTIRSMLRQVQHLRAVREQR
jgi:hypothetical protein